MAEKRYPAAERVLDQALPVVRRKWDFDDTELIRLEYLIALLEYKNLKYEQAERALAPLFPRLEAMYGSSEHESVVFAKKIYSEVLKKNGKSAEATRILSELGSESTASTFEYKPLLKTEELNRTEIFIGNKAVEKKSLRYLEDDVLISADHLLGLLTEYELRPLVIKDGAVSYGTVEIYSQTEEGFVPLFRLLQILGLNGYVDPTLGTIDFIRYNKAQPRPATVANQNSGGVNYNSNSGYSPTYTSPGYSGGSSSAGGSVQVRGYYRKDGTYVRPHTRHSPRRR